MKSEKALGLYLHIPFCRHRCAYCDFNTYTTVSDLMSDYVAALQTEIRQVGRGTDRRVATVYFGGGTPSLLPSDSLGHILREIEKSFLVNDDAEISIEANPETLSLDYLRQIRHAGVNRLSLGAQSADPAQLALLERTHDFDTVVRAVSDARTAGFESLSVDLIYGLPGQSLASWQESLKATLSLETQHLSLYCLTIEPGTPMNRWLISGRIEPPNPDLAADQYETAMEMLARHGFEHYEISNWALPGHACRHNVIYWRNGAYLGLGAGAHGHARGYRYSVVRQPRVYIRRMQDGLSDQYPWSAAVAEKHKLTRQDRMSDTVITQLRLLQEGLKLDGFARHFGVDLFVAFPGVCEQLIEWGLLRQEGNRLLLTRRGYFLSNQVFYRFM
jgi:oxygen-independent coproporphyrinogen-3 oxidase